MFNSVETHGKVIHSMILSVNSYLYIQSTVPESRYTMVMEMVPDLIESKFQWKRQASKNNHTNLYIISDSNKCREEKLQAILLWGNDVCPEIQKKEEFAIWRGREEQNCMCGGGEAEAAPLDPSAGWRHCV